MVGTSQSGLKQWLTLRAERARRHVAERLRSINSNAPAADLRLVASRPSQSVQVIAEAIGTFWAEAFDEAASHCANEMDHKLVHDSVRMLLEELVALIPAVHSTTDAAIGIKEVGRYDETRRMIASLRSDLALSSQLARLRFNRIPSEGPAERKRGRTPGSGTYAVSDGPLIEEMHRMIAAGKAKSVNDAARQVAHLAQGGATVESKQSRLARAYAKSSAALEIKPERD